MIEVTPERIREISGKLANETLSPEELLATQQVMQTWADERARCDQLHLDTEHGEATEHHRHDVIDLRCFCGSEAMISSTRPLLAGKDEYAVECVSCSMRGPYKAHEEDATAAWRRIVMAVNMHDDLMKLAEKGVKASAQLLDWIKEWKHYLRKVLSK